MPQTTILLADLPPMLEDIVFHLLQGRADVRILRGSAAGGVQAAAAAAGAQVVILTCADPESFVTLDASLAQLAALSIFTLTADGSWGCLHTLQPHAVRFDDISAAQLTAVLIAAEPAGRA